jgi:hypothetical protein
MTAATIAPVICLLRRALRQGPGKLPEPRPAAGGCRQCAAGYYDHVQGASSRALRCKWPPCSSRGARPFSGPDHTASFCLRIPYTRVTGLAPHVPVESMRPGRSLWQQARACAHVTQLAARASDRNQRGKTAGFDDHLRQPRESRHHSALRFQQPGARLRKDNQTTPMRVRVHALAPITAGPRGRRP